MAEAPECGREGWVREVIYALLKRAELRYVRGVRLLIAKRVFCPVTIHQAMITYTGINGREAPRPLMLQAMPQF